MFEPFSVLMPVYHRDNPDHLAHALASLLKQSLSPSQIVIVKDGPLGERLEAVLESHRRLHPDLFHIISLVQNQGLGPALAEGLKHCRYEYVARMDADDIAQFDRFEKQLRTMQDNPALDVVGSWMDEFQDTPDNIIAVKKVPEFMEDILRYSARRNPMNHPTVMLRKQAVLDAGNYGNYPNVEDYILWAKMLHQGSRFYNIQESLLWFRADKSMFQRRGGWKYIKYDIILQKTLLDMHRIGPLRCLTNIMIRGMVRVIPNKLRVWVYHCFLRDGAWHGKRS